MGPFSKAKQVVKSDPPWSFQDYLKGVAKVHKNVASIPGAQRMDPKLRAAQSSMDASQILEQYNENKLFGTTAKGEPLRAAIQDRNLYSTHKGKDLPDRGKMVLFPESKVPQEMDATEYTAPQMGFYEKDVHPQDADYAYHLRSQLRGQNNPRAFSPRMYNINAMGVTPPSNPGSWTEGLRSRGKEMYGAMYDMMRAGGHGNYADNLTPVNTVRRLGNVGSHAIGHGNLGFISPIDESIGMTTGLPGMKLKQNKMEDEYLESLFLPHLRPRNMGVVQDIRNITPGDLSSLSDDEKLGLLYLREAQLSGAYGPPTSSGTLTRISNMSPTDTAALRALAEPYVRANPGRLQGAFGPSTLGRQLTTESVIRRMMRGESPDEISEQLLRDAPEGGYEGRYQKGGRVKKVMTAVKSAIPSAADGARGLKSSSLSDEALTKALGLDKDEVPQVLPKKQRTQNFAQFLKPSKVQQRVYHGSPYAESIVEDKQFAHYAPGSSEIHWFTSSPKHAEEYTEKYMDDFGDGTGAIFPVNIQVKNPLEVPFNMNDRINPDFWKYAEDLGFDRYDFNNWRKENDVAPTRKVWHVVNSPQFRDIAQRRGFDGVAVKEGDHKTWGVFDTARVKSQFNEGTYDTSNPDIGKKKGGLVAALEG